MDREDNKNHLQTQPEVTALRLRIILTYFTVKEFRDDAKKKKKTNVWSDKSYDGETDYNIRKDSQISKNVT